MDSFLALKRFPAVNLEWCYEAPRSVRQQWFFDQISLAGTYYIEALIWEGERAFVADTEKLRRCHEICRFVLAMPELRDGWRGYASFYLATRFDSDGFVIYLKPLLMQALNSCEAVQKQLGLLMSVGERVWNALNQGGRFMWREKDIQREEMGKRERFEREVIKGQDAKRGNIEPRNGLNLGVVKERIVREDAASREDTEQNRSMPERTSWADEMQAELERENSWPQSKKNALYLQYQGTA